MKKLIFLLFVGLFFAVSCNNETPDTRRIVWKNDSYCDITVTMGWRFDYQKKLSAGGELPISGKMVDDFLTLTRSFSFYEPLAGIESILTYNPSNENSTTFEWFSSSPCDINSYEFNADTNTWTYTFTHEDHEAASTMIRKHSDPIPISLLAWKNESDHTISLSIQPRVPESVSKTAVLQPGEVCTREYIDTVPSGSTFAMTVRFDDAYEYTYGKYVYLYQRDFPAGYDRQYDPTWSPNFKSEWIDDGTEVDFHNPGGYTILTYTFTNADYEVAKRLSEAE